MARPYENKPFPASMYEWTKIRVRHFFCFWCLCNEFDANTEGWIEIKRLEFNKKINSCLPIQTHNPTLILETLQELEYIELQRFHRDPYNRNTTTDFRIRIRPDSWDPRVVVNKTYLQNNEKAADRRAFYRNRYAERKAKALALKES